MLHNSTFNSAYRNDGRAALLNARFAHAGAIEVIKAMDTGLHDPSIGCAPCTTPVAEGEAPRADRRRKTEKEECGIHFVNGKMMRSGDKI